MLASPITIVIIDDHAVVREGTRMILERYPDLSVVGESESGTAGIAEVSRLLPDVALVDIHLPDMSGIAVARELADAHPEIRIIMLTAFGDEDYLRASLAAGASGFLLKTAKPDEVVAAVRQIVGGQVPARQSFATMGVTRTTGDSVPPGESLTPREAEIIALVSEGLSNKAIAFKLGISRRTVEGHISRTLAKIGASSRTELLRFAIEHGIVVIGKTN